MLLAAVLLGGIRLLGLGAWSLWIDEAFTYTDGRHLVDIEYPVGYLLFRWCYDLFGGVPTEAQLRLPAALLGWACVPLTAWALRPLCGARAAAVAALLVALSPWHLYWSQNARFYTLVQALGLFGGGVLVRGVLGAGWSAVLGGATLLAVGALVHPTEVLLGAGLILAPLLLVLLRAWPGERIAKGSWWGLVGLLAIVLAGGSVWIVGVLKEWDQIHGESTVAHLALSLGYLVTPMVGLGVAVGCWQALASRRPSRLLLAVVVVGLGSAFVGSLFFRVSAQYVFVFLPWLAGLAALPFGTTWSVERSGVGWPPMRGVAYLGLMVVPLVIECALYFGVRNGDRPHWREAYAYVIDHREPTDLLLGMQSPVAEYYLAPENPRLRLWTWIAQYDPYRTYMPARWARYGRRTWMVLNMEQLQEWSPRYRGELLRLLAEQATLEAHFEVPWTPRDLDVRVYLWRGVGP